jgi:uncharacterized protein DUF1329
MKFIEKLLLTIVAIYVGISASSVAMAQVKPGDTITPENASKVKNLVSPGVYYMVSKGMHIEVVPTQRVDWPPPYREATEKYASQVQMSPDHRSLVGYAAGQPFPFLDPNDPYVATKLMWNNVFRPISSDDYDLRFFDCQTEYVRPGQAQNIVNDIWVGHYAGYSLVGRTEVEPLPIDPNFKQTGRLWLFALYPLLAPQEYYGYGEIRFRYADPRRDDDRWIWDPGARRIRRESNTMMSSATGTQTFDPDHYSGFNPKVEDYNYKFLGEKNMLACVHARHSPEVTCPYDGGATACPEAWEMRHVYIVSAIPRQSEIGGGGVLSSQNILYLDSEVWFQSYVDTYDRQGHLWKTNIFWLANRDRPVPDARVAIYPFAREFVVGSDSIDVQAGMASMCYLPGRNTPEHECWYINMGAVDRSFFTVQAMTAAAR